MINIILTVDPLDQAYRLHRYIDLFLLLSCQQVRYLSITLVLPHIGNVIGANWGIQLIANILTLLW